MNKPARKSKINTDKFRETWLATRNIGESLLAAGGSPKSAARGYSALNKACKAIVDGIEKLQPADAEIEALIERLKTSDDVTEYIREKIIRAIELGESPKSLEAHLKLLGTFKEHNIFEAKKSNEIFVIAPPESAFDSMDEIDTKKLLEECNGIIELRDSGKTGLLLAQNGQIVRLRIFGASVELGAA